MAVNPVEVSLPMGALFGQGGGGVDDPEDFERRRAQARKALAEAMGRQYAPHPFGVAAAGLNSVTAALEDRMVRAEQEKARAEMADLMTRLYGGGTGAPGSGSVAGSSVPSSPSPAPTQTAGETRGTQAAAPIPPDIAQNFGIAPPAPSFDVGGLSFGFGDEGMPGAPMPAPAPQMAAAPPPPPPMPEPPIVPPAPQQALPPPVAPPTPIGMPGGPNGIISDKIEQQYAGALPPRQAIAQQLAEPLSPPPVSARSAQMPGELNLPPIGMGGMPNLPPATGPGAAPQVPFGAAMGFTGQGLRGGKDVSPMLGIEDAPPSRAMAMVPPSVMPKLAMVQGPAMPPPMSAPPPQMALPQGAPDVPEPRMVEQPLPRKIPQGMMGLGARVMDEGITTSVPPVGEPPKTEDVISSTPPAAPRGPVDTRYLDQIKKFEGFYEKPYWDYRQWTSGYGTKAQGPNERIDRATAESRLNAELTQARNIVEKTAPNAPEGVKAALTSLTFNAGPSWAKGQLGAAVQRGDYDTAQRIFTQYNKAGGSTLPGLVNRRNAEAQWFKDTSGPTQTAAAPTAPEAPPAPNPQSTGLIQMAQSGQGMTPELFKQMLLNPYTRGMAQSILQQEIQNRYGGGKATDDMREYELARRQGFQGSFVDYQKMMKEAGRQQINIDQRGESEFEKKAAGAQAQRYNDAVEAGNKARVMQGDIMRMRELSDRLGTQGATADIKKAIGPYANALGIDVANLSDIEAFSSVISKLAPTMRPPGSGATSDFEFRQFLNALPQMSQTPQGRKMILDQLDALSNYQAAVGDISDRVLNRELDRKQAQEEIRKLGNPLELWRKMTGEQQPGPSAGQPPQIRTPQEYEALPPGTVYIAPDGQPRRKR